MFGDYISNQGNNAVEKAIYEAQDDARYASANSRHQVIIDTQLGRVYINDSSYFSNVPEIAWNDSVRAI